MSDHIQLAIADLKVRRDELNHAISALERLNGVPAPAAAPARAPKQASKQARGRNQPPARSVARRPRVNTDLDVKGQADGALSQRLLALLGKRVSMAPAELVAGTGADKHAVRHVLKGLMRLGQVQATGATISRRFSLAGRTPAKEAP